MGALEPIPGRDTVSAIRVSFCGVWVRLGDGLVSTATAGVVGVGVKVGVGVLVAVGVGVFVGVAVGATHCPLSQTLEPEQLLTPQGWLGAVAGVQLLPAVG